MQIPGRHEEPEDAGSQVSRRLRSRRVRFGPNALVVFSILAFLLTSGVVVAVFNAEIRDHESSVQADYLIDAYYYVYLGRQAGQIADRGAESLYSAAESISPNVASRGVVFLSAFLLQIIRWDFLIPAALALLLFTPIIILYRGGGSSALLLSLPFCGLLPYLSVTSKEAFLIFGLLLLAISVTARRYLFLAGVGAAAMYLARPEAFYIFVACAGAWKLSRTRVGMGVTIVLATGVYFLFAREAAREGSMLLQGLMEQADLAFCTVGPLNVCVEDSANLEWLYLVRLVSLAPLPLKWVADATAAFSEPSLLWSERIIRWGNLLHLIWLYAAVRHSRPVTGETLALRKTLILFAVVYWCVYGSIFYFQPTRQAILASTFLGLAFLLRDRRKPLNDGSRLAANRILLQPA